MRLHLSPRPRARKEEGLLEPLLSDERLRMRVSTVCRFDALPPRATENRPSVVSVSNLKCVDVATPQKGVSTVADSRDLDVSMRTSAGRPRAWECRSDRGTCSAAPGHPGIPASCRPAAGSPAVWMR